MKKILTIVLILTILLIPFGCHKNKTAELKDKVSYYETHLYTGESNNFAVNLLRGMREDIFIADGMVGNMIKFATLKVLPLHMDLFNKQYSFKLTGTDKEITGELKKDMFGASFSAEILDIDSLGEIKNITISAAKIEETIELTNKMKDKLTWEDVLRISSKEFKDCIESESADGGFNREIHIKFINNRTDRHSPYYWYVSYINTVSDYWALLLDPETGEAISKKN